MKIALIGAGSHFFESVFLELGQTPELHGAEIFLYDIDAQRMQLIDMVGRRISDHFGAFCHEHDSADDQDEGQASEEKRKFCDENFRVAFA